MDRFDDFCRSFEEVLAQQTPMLHRIEEGRKRLSELTAQMDWYKIFLERMVLDQQFRESQKPTLWPNEFTLYRSPSGSFVASLFFILASLRGSLRSGLIQPGTNRSAFG